MSDVFAHPEKRAEAEFYLAPNGVQKNYVLGEAAISFAQYGTSDELNEEGVGFPVLRLNEISNGFVEDAEKYCATLTAKEFAELQLKRGDVLVCRTNGNPRLVGKAGIAMEDAKVAYASYLFRVRPDPTIISPAALAVFLNCANGRLEIEKHSVRSNQVNFSPERLRQARVPKFSSHFLKRIDSTVASAYLHRRNADSVYTKGESMLLQALSLDTWKPPEPLTYTCLASEAFARERIDAEHFQPKYKALLAHIRKQAARCSYVDEFAVFCDRGDQPTYFDDGLLSVVNSRHILETGLDYDNFERTDARYWNDVAFKTARIYQHDILTYTTGANIGRTAAYLSEEKALASNHVNLLRVIGENPIYVAAVMNSMIGRWQTYMYATGSAQVELYPNDVRRFIIPFVDAKTEKTVIGAVESSHDSRQRSHALLDAVKRAVEIAIDDSEAVAMSILKTQGV